MGTGKLKEKEFFIFSIYLLTIHEKYVYFSSQGRIKLDESPVPVGLF